MSLEFDPKLHGPKVNEVLVRRTSSSQTRKPNQSPTQIADEIVQGIVDSAFSQAELRAYQRKQHAYMTPASGSKLMIHPLASSPSKHPYPAHRQRPNWLDSTHRLLNRLAESNQEEPVSSEDLAQIHQVADDIIRVGDPIQSLLFLKLLSDFIFAGAKGIFFYVLKSLRSKHPDIEIYFKDVDVDDPDEGPAFTPEAIARIFRFFEEEYEYPVGLLSVQPLSALPGLVEGMFVSDDDAMHGWVVYNDEIEDDPHTVPIFAIKKEGKTHIFIFDAQGHTFSKDKEELKISASLEKLIEHFKDADPDQLAIYSYQNRRQFSDLGCSTFVILDLKNLLERHIRGPGNIVDFYASQGEALQPKLGNSKLPGEITIPIYEISTLPAEMMKVTQSHTRIRQYSVVSPVDDQVPNVERYSDSGATYSKPQDFADLTVTVSEISRVDPDGHLLNLYVDQKRLKFIVTLLSLQFKSDHHPRRSLFPVVFPDSKDIS